MASSASGACPIVTAVIETTLSPVDFTRAFQDACRAAANSTMKKIVRVKGRCFVLSSAVAALDDQINLFERAYIDKSDI